MQLLKDLHQQIHYAIPLYCDNESAIRLADNPFSHARTKHVEVHYHFVRGKVLLGETELKHINTKDQVADLFTKGLSDNIFGSFYHQFGVVERMEASVERDS